MSHPWEHAKSSAKKWGGEPGDYIAIHDWFDASKGAYADTRHRAARHHSEGIFWAEERFGALLVRPSDGGVVYTRYIGEQHVLEDLGWIPTLKDWLSCIQKEPWMRKGTNLVKTTTVEI